MEEKKVKERVYITGHRNPDTDSICSAVAYAELKQQTGCPSREYTAYRAGQLNEETKFVLEHFGVEAPQYIGTVQPEICDVELNLVGGVESSDSIKRAWDLMDEQGSRSLPVLSDGILEGIISITDIAQSYMDESDSHVLANAKTSFASIAETLNGRIICDGKNKFFDKGKVAIAASSPDLMEEFIQESDLVIVGNRFETHFTAIELDHKEAGGRTWMYNNKYALRYFYDSKTHKPEYTGELFHDLRESADLRYGGFSGRHRRDHENQQVP